MKILCANWQAADEAELEREHYPDIEFILARSTNEKAAKLDPSICRTVDAVINYSPTHNVAAASDAFTKARIAVRSGVGFDNIDTAGWGARKIPACNVPDYGTTEVADHAIGLMLALTRGTSCYGAELMWQMVPKAGISPRRRWCVVTRARHSASSGLAELDLPLRAAQQPST